MNACLVIFALVFANFVVGSVQALKPQTDPLLVRNENSTHRSISTIRFDVLTALRAEAVTRRRGPNASDVMRLTDLYREMAVHPERDNSALLKQLGLKLRLRLEKVRDQIERQYSHADQHTSDKKVPSAAVVPEAHVLAQLVAVEGGAALGQGAQSTANQPGAARTVDYGLDLVELIESTISPATWNINGGHGSVVYFAPLRVIVVSAPGTVHDQVGDVLGQLRAAP